MKKLNSECPLRMPHTIITPVSSMQREALLMRTLAKISTMKNKMLPGSDCEVWLFRITFRLAGWRLWRHVSNSKTKEDGKTKEVSGSSTYSLTYEKIPSKIEQFLSGLGTEPKSVVQAPRTQRISVACITGHKSRQCQ